MSEAPPSSRAAELAREFDRGFTEPRRSAAPEREDFLALRAAGDRYVVAVREIAGLFVDRKVVPLPASAPELLGVAALRVGVVPVYSLAALLGQPPGAPVPRWMLLVQAEAPLGLAFEQFDGYLRASQAERSSVNEPGGRAMVRIGDGWHGVLGIPALIDDIEARGPGPETKNDKER